MSRPLPASTPLVNTSDGTATQPFAAYLRGIGNALGTARVDVGAPASSTDPIGKKGELRLVGEDLYYRTGTQWLKLTGVTF